MPRADFTIAFEPRGDGAFRTRVLASPGGDASGTFSLPLAPGALRTLASQVAASSGRARRASTGTPADRAHTLAQQRATERLLTQAGQALHAALFQGAIAECWARALGSTHAAGGLLRLTLHVDVGSDAAVLLQRLPWEYLRARDGLPLALDRRTPLVRSIPLGLPPTPAPTAGNARTRVLVVAASPAQARALQLEHELSRVRAAFAARPDVQVDALPDATPGGLLAALQEHDVHVLHFMGHGGLDAARGQGVLLFHDEHGAVQALPGGHLAAFVRGRGLRLAVLNACEGAASAGLDATAGAASALMVAGLPAVVAMQFEISDPAALAFSDVFYRRLAAGDLLDMAMSEARQGVLAALPDASEWGTPVLFLRDGHTFALVPTPAQQIAVALPPAGPPKPRAARIALATALLMAAVLLALWQGRTDRGPQAVVTSPAAPPTATPWPPPGRQTTASPATRRPAPPTPAPSAPAPQVYTLADLDTVDLPEWSGQLSAQFSQQFGQDLVRLVLAAEDVIGPAPAPVMGPDIVEFAIAGGTPRRLQVLSVDFARRRVRVRALLH